MFPITDTYLVLDIETTGFRPTEDFVLQVGWLFCRNGKIVSNSAVFVATPEDVLHAYDVGDYVTKQISEGNDGYVKSADVRNFGHSASDVFENLKQLCANVMAIPGACIVGHNFCDFDMPFIECFARKNGVELTFDRNRLFDTGCFFKAHKLGVEWDGERFESVYDWFIWIKSIRKRGLKWAVHVCLKDLKLDQKYNLDTAATHDAGFDALCEHYIYEYYREQLRVGVT